MSVNYLDMLPLELQDYIWELHHKIEFKKVMIELKDTRYYEFETKMIANMIVEEILSNLLD
tara:strand:+ start:209 stop:391 length:183 start_codon:yes stop_codon:yes gene_type:complete